jgi:hypothetical protein
VVLDLLNLFIHCHCLQEELSSDSVENLDVTANQAFQQFKGKAVEITNTGKCEKSMKNPLALTYLSYTNL